MEEPPYRCEYAKSGRAGCKGCKDPIAKDKVRLAIMVQSRFFDGMQPNWFHDKCFWKKAKVTNESQIGGLDNLRWEDQEKIRQNISSDSGPATIKNSKGKDTGVYSDFHAEYAKSGASICRGCNEKIAKNLPRLAYLDYESEQASMYGPVPRWHHVDCFVEKRLDVGFTKDMKPEKMHGFRTLKKEDKDMILEKLGKGDPLAAPSKRKLDAPNSTSPEKKAKSTESEMSADLKKQSEMLWKIKDQLNAEVSKKAMQLLLEYNNQKVPPGESTIIERLADCMAFGALEQCKDCKNGQLVFSTTANAYRCLGDATEFTKCMFFTQAPKRKAFRVPSEFHDVDFLKKYKYVKRERIYPLKSVAELSGTSLTADSSSSSTKGSTDDSKPLRGMSFFICPKPGKLTKPQVTKLIDSCGGTVVGSIDKRTTAVVASTGDVQKMTKNIQTAKENGVHVISSEFFNEAKGGKAVSLIMKHSIASWGDDVKGRIREVVEGHLALKSGAGASVASKMTSGFMKSQMRSVKMKVKGGAAVDPDSELDDVAHVLQDGPDCIYNAVLGMVDVVQGTNSFYKLQALEADKGSRYWVFRAWGRIGTIIGGNKVEQFGTKDSAVFEFERLYQEKTGNVWANRKCFKKVPGRFYPMEIDYGQDDEDVQKLTVEVGGSSKLPMAVQQLVQRLFDIESMKKAMVEFEIDLQKMPLGKLSRNQINQAYTVLKDLQKLLDDNAKPTMVLDATNRFYTLIPHDFGMQKPTLLDNQELIKIKCEMLDNLKEIEVAYNLLKAGKIKDAEKDPIDVHYEQLKTDIEILEPDCDEFKKLVEYTKLTHAATHSSYTLEVEHIFKVNRQGEYARFKPFSKLANRMLLWHGSRTTNYAGILSQGLRIAPPEAPVTGYMFGKGVYFADMVSKSANYCFTNKSNPTGLLLLCDVALGNMHELKHSSYITKLPKGKHSTKGLGSTAPDTSTFLKTEENVTIPLGKGQDSGVSDSSLLYNEYIVYDVAQINIKYLLQMNFKWKY